MTNPKRSRAPRKAAAAAQKQHVSVRMYDVGFGDCFLVKLPTRKGVRKMLFDCGSINAGSKPMQEVVQQVIEDVRDEPGGPPRIDVVVATHRHRDHVSGFANPAWAEVEVGEVWMPWTEDPQDSDGQRIRATQSRLAALLNSQFSSSLAAAADPAERSRLESFQELALNALSNENAMRTLQRGFSGNPLRRYLPEANAGSSWLETPLLPGVVLHVLGPSRDPETILELNPPVGQSYLRFAEAPEASRGSPLRPFGVDWQMSSADYSGYNHALFQGLTDENRERIRKAGFGMDEAAAVTLDGALNGTSLMLYIQVGAATLLFPGDAQWGTWRKALETPDVRRLLEGVNFYKVGHHGSHNATPVEFIEQVAQQDLWAMVST